MSGALSRAALVAHLDEYLEIGAWSERALNGLQVEGADAVTRIALATDAALATIAGAVEAGAQALLVHHGLFWGAAEPVAGPHRTRLAALLDGDLTLYAAHLPLDAHPQVGNNAVLAGLLEVAERAPFGRVGEQTIGWQGRLPAPLARAALAARLEALLEAPPDVLAFGPPTIARVAIVSGEGTGFIAEAAAAGVDALITGETSHIAWHRARELNLNVFFAGHYATETLGVQALGRHLAARFGVETVFLDVPTGY
ncbi:MAG: Nif3-like dinuclear metal center hexameric protein [Gemmatimonadota bacterium]